MANPTTIKWIAPTLNTDGTPIVGGEITGYDVGVRPSSGTVGTYPSGVSVTGAATLSAAISSVTPALLSGSYQVAVRSAGPSDSAWSAEVAFNLVGVPVPPTGLSVS